jgi:CHAT domain-containing protein/tetratricopeptide (TPR) repeat protein
MSSRLSAKSDPLTPLQIFNARACCFLFEARWTCCILLALAIGCPAPTFGEPNELKSLHARVAELREQGKYSEAAPLAKQYADEVRAQSGEDSADYASALADLGLVLTDADRYTEAEPVIRRAISLLEANYGPDDRRVAWAIKNLANLLRATNRLEEAEPWMRRSIQLLDDIFGSEDPHVAAGLSDLADLLLDKGQLPEAEDLYQRSIAIVQRRNGMESPLLSAYLGKLGQILMDTERFAEAEPLFRRAIAIAKRASSPDYSDLAAHLVDLANLLFLTGRPSEAEPLYRQALQIDEQNLGPLHVDNAITLQNLARLLQATGRRSEAEPLYRHALAIAEQSLGPDHPETSRALTNLARPLAESGHLNEAEALLRRALAIDRRNYGPGDSRFATSLANVAVVLEMRQDYAGAVALYEQALPLMVQDRGRGAIRRADSADATLTNHSGSLQAYASDLYRNRAKREDALVRGFEAAQWAFQSSAADGLSQMALRVSRGPGPLASLVREQQDALAQRQSTIRQLDSSLGRADAKSADEERTLIVSLDKTLDALDAEMVDKFKDYATLSASKPLTLHEVQTLLHPDEALVVYLDVPQFSFSAGRPGETLVWAITKTKARWQSIESAPQALSVDVTALRCGLDFPGAWIDGKGAWDGSRCNGILRSDYSNALHEIGKPLPFDLARANKLYRTLFGPIEDMIEDKHLLIVPSGPLTQLPFQVLVTDDPKVAKPSNFAEYRNVAWLARKHAMTVLPAVSSLKALREFAKESHASEPYIGFGNPLLNGPNTLYKKLADEARAKQRCEDVSDRAVAAADTDRGGVQPLPVRGGLANVAQIRAQVPLPETADELCEVARDLGSKDVRLGAVATEAEVKRLSETGDLSRYRVIHFATHGALAGQVRGNSEPGLLLTPPDEATETDDGYLTASEIAGLKLDADWVILSACNTAAGDAKGAEALSGLARAFFYAGVRSLLVSHWEVSSDSTVRLITKAIAELKTDPKIGRAEALRRSMLDLIDKGKTYEAHPAFWAPFVLVGEGGAAL